MDKYRLLITGKNKAVIDDFFNHTGNEFETVSTSDRMDDIRRLRNATSRINTAFFNYKKQITPHRIWYNRVDEKL